MANRKEPDLGEDDFEALPTRGQNDARESRRPGDECSAGGLPKGWVLVVLAGPGAGIQGQRRLVVMGFNRREMEDQRRTAAQKEAVTRRREFLWSLASF